MSGFRIHNLLAMVAVRDRVTLSPQEKRTLEYLSHGLTYQMTADAMSLSSHTIRVYARNARYLMKAKNTPHAVANALRQGVIQ